MTAPALNRPSARRRQREDLAMTEQQLIDLAVEIGFANAAVMLSLIHI